MNYSLPSEIISNIFEYVSMTDLVRVERTCKLFQSFALCEIEKRIIRSSKDEWGILIHLGQVLANPVRFDPETKLAYYAVAMDPVKIKTMFDHRRPIHCSLLRKSMTKKSNNIRYQSYSEKGFIITVEKGMQEGKTLQLDVKNELCQVHASLTRLPSAANIHHQQHTKEENTLLKSAQPIKSMAPSPLTYTLQITELCLPLSTIAK
ncbi:hypothetical protein INT47_000148 [Mucor saturninus]|uniref:F-box domain-containing protein n=1 Tax=Mucor saturninus TaxID=64648 RepID=A0A8H7RJX2_9FUNG|nr:hypothetical protein INT47_000148 [Mucor saturninus]